ncbi:hypothetical protein [Roseibium alexandrii]|uniref:hypothetical protein n=1 Tax=Roseibium alexandrii TaxID=388408 RepID=UPI0039926F86
MDPIGEPCQALEAIKPIADQQIADARDVSVPLDDISEGISDPRILRPTKTTRTEPMAKIIAPHARVPDRINRNCTT